MLPLHRSNHHAVDDPLKMFLFLFQELRRATELQCIMVECVQSRLRPLKSERPCQHWDQCRLVREFKSEKDLSGARHSLRAVPGMSQWELLRQAPQGTEQRTTLLGASVEIHPHEGGLTLHSDLV